MTFALIDDEQLQLNILSETLQSALDKMGIHDRKINCYSDAKTFIEHFEAGRFDIVILDIYMDDINGIDVARKIREQDENVTLAFCTSSNEFASQSYDVKASDYLQKPISEEKVLKMLTRFNLAKIERNRSILLSDGFRVTLRNIIYTEYINHSVQFHIKGQNPHIIRCSQSMIETLLTQYKGFFVINKGCIINFAQVKAIETNAFQMQNGETVSVARRRFKEIEIAYTRYIFEKMEAEMGR